MSNLDRIARLFRARQGQWISALSLAKAGGLLSFRTRVSELRRLSGWDIENRVDRTPTGAKSFYRLRGMTKTT